MKAKVNVCVTDKKAIYVNDHRITNRSTKWGIHTNIDEFKCDKSEVVLALIKNGHSNILKLIEEEPYLSQIEELGKL